MERLVLALAPAFAAGFAIQQLLEILTPLFTWLKLQGDLRKSMLSLLSLGLGVIIAIGSEMRVLEPLGLINAKGIDIAITAVIISAGTEGFNSIMKFLGYAKEKKKQDAKKMERVNSG